MIFILFFLLVLFCFFLLTSLALSTASAWVFQGTFSEGWAACWDRWYIVLAWALIFTCIFGFFRDD